MFKFNTKVGGDMENLGLRLITSIDQGKSLSQINKDLKSLEGKLKTLDINIGLDTKKLNQFFNQATKDINYFKSQINEAFSVDQNALNENYGAIQKHLNGIQKQYGGTFKSIKDVSTGLDGDAHRFVAELKIAEGLIKKIDLRKIYDKKGNPDFKIFSVETLNNIEKQEQAEERRHQKAIKNAEDRRKYELWWEQQADKLDKNREQALTQEMRIRKQLQNEEDKQIANKQRLHREELKFQDELERSKRLELEREMSLEHQIDKAKRLANVRVNNFKSANRKYISDDQNQALDDYLKKVNRISADTPDAKRELDRLGVGFREIKGQVQETANKTMGLTEKFREAIVATTIWAGAMTAFYGSAQALTSMVQTITEVDTAVTELKKVMDQDTNFEGMLDDAITKAKELGQTVDNVLASFAEAGRQGLNRSDINSLSEASLITANVGEMEAGKSAEYLTASIEQMKMEYKDAMSIVDGWNSVNL